MPDFHPAQTLQAVEMFFPVPGSSEPWAVIRWVDIMREGEPVSCWRAVTHAEPRELIGYSDDLRALAMQCHRLAIVRGGRPELNLTPRPDQAEYVHQPRPAGGRSRSRR